MPRTAASPPLPLRPRSAKLGRSQWLYTELRRLILERVLRGGARLPSTRELADEHGLSRGTVVNVYEQLKTEGYLSSLPGGATRVTRDLPDRWLRVEQTARRDVPPPHEAPTSPIVQPSPFALSGANEITRAFRPNRPSLKDFPVDLWARLTARRIRLSRAALLADGDAQGSFPLRQAIADYLGESRGVAADPKQIVIVSGTQHALDLVSRILLHAGDAVWLEDPGYVGARAAFASQRAKIIPVPVDAEGLDVARGIRLAPRAKLAYVTPAHQAPLGMPLSVRRRLELLQWARQNGAYIFEDDYDSEYRFRGQPLGALKSLAGSERVILAGSFGKMLFSGLRLGYLVLPNELVEATAHLRSSIDRFPPLIEQAVLNDFIREGYFGQHVRRMRLIYAERHASLTAELSQHLPDVLALTDAPAGLQIAAQFRGRRKTSDDVSLARLGSEKFGLELWPLSRFCLKRTDIKGFLLGFADLTPPVVAENVLRLKRLLKS